MLALKYTIGVRVDADVEIKGLDMFLHHELAYHDPADEPDAVPAFEADPDTEVVYADSVR